MIARFVIRSPIALAIAIAPVVIVWSASAAAALSPTKTALGADVSTGGTTSGPSTGSPGSDLAAAALDKKSISLGTDTGESGWSVVVPPTHTVRKGDTLWDICDHYFHNPWQWPRVWSYNPEIVNPHWIYPGEIVRLKKDGTMMDSAPLMGSGIVKPKTVQPGTVFLRDQGFIYDEQTEDTGEIVGSPEDRMLLSTYEKVYVRVTEDQAKKLSPGDTLTIFEPSRAVKRDGDEIGKVVQILGTLRVDSIDSDTHLVEATITEALDVIERGARVGPIERHIDVVPATTNGVDLRGTILASVHPTVMYGQNQVVFIDSGSDQGVHIGNRLFIVRKGDPWRKGLSSSGGLAASKVTLNTDGPATVEKKGSDTPEDAPDYPEEVVAEVRVLSLRKTTATCIVTSSTRELEPGDVWVMKKGY